MWSFKALHILALVTILTSCGFEPALQSSGKVDDFLRSIAIEEKDGRSNFEFRRAFHDLVGSDASPHGAYELRYNLDMSQSAISISETSAIERFTVFAVLDFSLYVAGSEIPVFQDRIRFTAGYSATTAAYPTQVAERDAKARLSSELAQQLYQLLILNADIILK